MEYEWADGGDSTSDSNPEASKGIGAEEREATTGVVQAVEEPGEGDVSRRGYSIRPVQGSFVILDQSPEDSVLREKPKQSWAIVEDPSENVAYTIRLPQISVELGRLNNLDFVGSPTPFAGFTRQ